MKRNLSVAVVGAGISGLVAARSLFVQDVDVTVFEKSRGPGGRASTRRHGEHAFDHGAQYFTVRDDRFGREVRYWLGEEIVELWQPRLAVLGQGGAVEIKDKGPERFVGVPKMSSIGRFLSTDLNLVVSTRVGELRRHEDGWEVLSEEGLSLGSFDAAVVAIPPAQAADLLVEAPALRRRAQDVVLQPCWAAMAVFEEALGLPYDAAFVHRSPLSWIARNASKPGRPQEESWVLHGSPRWSSEHLEEEAEAVGEKMLKAFFSATERKASAPGFLRIHRWRYSIAEEPLAEGCLWDEDLRIGICGDWCAGSRIEGAYLSGLELACKILS